MLLFSPSSYFSGGKDAFCYSQMTGAALVKDKMLDWKGHEGRILESYFTFPLPVRLLYRSPFVIYGIPVFHLKSMRLRLYVLQIYLCA